MAAPVGGALVQWLAYGAAAVPLGAAVCSSVLADSFDSERRARLLLWVRRAGMIFLVAGAVRMIRHGLAFAESVERLPQMIVTLLGTLYGTAWTVQMVGAVILASWTDRSSSRNGLERRAVLWLPSLMVLLPYAVQGHAISSEELTVVAVIADGVHLLGAGAWIGSLAVLVGVLLPGLNAVASEGAVRKFSPWALGGAAALGTTGLFASWLHVRHLPLLWTSRYGQVLLFKSALILGVLVIGALNWRRFSRRMNTDAGASRLLTSARTELVLAMAVFLVTAFLVATPLPGE